MWLSSENQFNYKAEMCIRDRSLNAESTNPVENRAVAAKLGEVEANTIFDSSAELSDDETTVHVSLKNKSGVEVTGFDIPAGGGGGGGEGLSLIHI